MLLAALVMPAMAEKALPKDMAAPGASSAIARGAQTASSPQTTAKTETMTLTPEQERELRKLMRWQDEIITYHDCMVSFVNSFNQAMALKNASGYGSLLQAQSHIDHMKDILAKVKSMVPDDDMRAGHMKLLSAFNLMIQCLVLNPAPQKLYLQSQGDLAVARGELAKWKAQYDAAEDRFIRATTHP
jgi:hypothetical protein